MSTRILYLIVGYTYMWIRHRDKEKIKDLLHREYNNNYAEVGFLVIWKPFMVIFLVLIACFVIGAIISIFRHGIT